MGYFFSVKLERADWSTRVAWSILSPYF